MESGERNPKTTDKRTITIIYDGKTDVLKFGVQNYVTFYPSGGYWGNNPNDTAGRTVWVDLETKTVDNPGELSKENHIFDGWYTENGTKPWDFNIDKVNADISLYAKWTADISGEIHKMSA